MRLHIRKSATALMLAAFLAALMVLAGRASSGGTDLHASREVQKELDKMKTDTQTTEQLAEDGSYVQSTVNTTTCDDGTRIEDTTMTISYPNGAEETRTISDTQNKDGSGECITHSTRRLQDSTEVITETKVNHLADGTTVTREKVTEAAPDESKTCTETITSTDSSGALSTEESRYRIGADGSVIVDDE